MSLPKTMKAYKCQGEGKAEIVDVPLPSLRPDYILVKVNAVALNPTDWKHIDFIPKENATVGCDYSGTVVEVGAEVKKSFSKGDRIAGFAHGVNAVQPEDGTFAEYAMVKGDVQFKIPKNFSDEEAACLGVGINTVGQGLSMSLGLPMPDSSSKPNEFIFVYGGSTATGLFALQYAKIAGLKPITACSPRNFDLVKKYGAEAAFDYADAKQCAKSIREHTNDSLKYAFDTISTEASAQICADALSSTGGKYSNLLPLEFPRKDVESGYTLAYTSVGEAFEFRGGTKVPAKKEDFDFAVKLWDALGSWIADGKIKPIPMDVRSGGLEGVPKGLDDLRNNKVSGTKLVYRVGGA